MGRIRTGHVKRSAERLLREHKEEFTKDFEKNKKNVRKAGYYYIVFSGSLKDIPFTTKTKKEVLAYIGEKWATKFDRMFDNEDSWWTAYKGFIIVRLRFAKVKAKGDNKRKTLFKQL